MCESRSFIKKRDIGLHRSIRGICVIGGQRDISLTAPAAVRRRELTMSEVMGINNADAWPNKNSPPPRLFSERAAKRSSHISPNTTSSQLWVEGWSSCLTQSSSLVQCPAFNCVLATSRSSGCGGIKDSAVWTPIGLKRWPYGWFMSADAAAHTVTIMSRSVIFINCRDSPFMKTAASLILLKPDWFI